MSSPLVVTQDAIPAPLLDALRTYGLSLPEATEDFPWGERVLKVKNKVFVFMGMAKQTAALRMSVKLPLSGEKVLTLPFAKPTGYGLGKSGWVSLQFAPGDLPSMELVAGWVLESYRAVAPKKLLKQLDGGAPARG